MMTQVVPDLLILAGTKAINDDQSFVSHEAADRMCENASLYFPRVQQSGLYWSQEEYD